MLSQHIKQIMSLSYIDSDSDVEEEYLAFCSENKVELNCIVRHTQILSRLRTIEKLNDSLLWQLEKAVEAMFELSERFNKSLKRLSGT